MGLENIIISNIKTGRYSYFIEDSIFNNDKSNPDDYYELIGKIHENNEEKSLYHPSLLGDSILGKKKSMRYGLENLMHREYIGSIYGKDSKYNPRDIGSIIYGGDSEFNPYININRAKDDSLEGYEIDPQEVRVEVASQRELPSEHQELLQKLRQEHPGVQYAGMVSLADKSMHNVDILYFEYRENGETRVLRIIAKDKDKIERIVPSFLNEFGIETPSLYDAHTRMFTRFVGQQDLRDVITNASEEEIMKACFSALDKISQIHVLASSNLHILQDEFGLSLDVVDYNAKFVDRFVKPVSDYSPIITPQMQRLMKVYSSFVEGFSSSSFIHGDFHSRNNRISPDECFVIDYEMASVGEQLEDVSRFIRSILVDKPTIDPNDFTQSMATFYIKRHNEYAREFNPQLALSPQRMNSLLQYSLINDELYKIGDYIRYAKTHPGTEDEKMQKCKVRFTAAMSMLDQSAKEAEKQKDNTKSSMLYELKDALRDFVALSPYKQLSETAIMHNKYKSPIMPPSEYHVPSMLAA